MNEALIMVFVIIFAVFCGIVYSIIMQIEKDDTPPRQEPPRLNNISHNFRPTNSETPRMRFGDENIYPDEWRDINRLSERERDRLLRGKIQRFWNKALEYSIQYIEQRDFESLSEFLANIWGTRDLAESADDLHTLTENVIERLYPYRDNPQCRELIYTLCRLVLSNADNYIAQKKRSTI